MIEWQVHICVGSLTWLDREKGLTAFSISSEKLGWI